MGKFDLSQVPLLGPFTHDQVLQVHEAAIKVLAETGVFIDSNSALDLLAANGAEIDAGRKIAKISASMVEKAIIAAPEQFQLYDGAGRPAALIGGNRVHFDPGSCAVRFLEDDGVTARDSTAADLDQVVRLTDALPHIGTQATAIVCHDAPNEIADTYRLYIILRASKKPIVTGAFSVQGLHDMKDVLAAVAGSPEELAKKPRAVFDVCPSPPLKFANLAAHNIIDGARAGLPIEFVSMPMPGAASPATIAGSVVQHTAETLAGVVLTECAKEGAKVVWGGAPVVFDMRFGTTPLSAVEATLIGMASAQMGKYYGLPTHTYAALSDSKMVDAQSGAETALSGMLAALAGVNIISGPGLIDFVNTISLAKLVIDNDICGQIYRALRGVEVNPETLAVDVIKAAGPGGYFLSLAHTRRWYRKEIDLPSAAFDRHDRRGWQEAGSLDTYSAALRIAHDILDKHPGSPPPPAAMDRLDRAMREVAARNGVTGPLPLGPN
ncbi:MAG TPA: trimethylamine methyltransferase family protein [Bacillota bacterium]